MLGIFRNEHAAECPVTSDRLDLLAKLALTPADSTEAAGLRGAVVEYDEGGDQEVERCTCGRAGVPH